MSLNVRYTWTHEQKLFLVQCVEKRERLWKKHSSIPYDFEMRNVLWQEIQTEVKEQFGLDVGVLEMKKTWKNLKDNFVRVSKEDENYSEKVNRWYFYDNLRFLEDTNHYGYIEESGEINYKKFKGDEQALSIIPQFAEEDNKKGKGVTRRVLISIPEIDCLIKTKQVAPEGVIYLRRDPDIEKYRELTEGLWDSLESSQGSPEDLSDDDQDNADYASVSGSRSGSEVQWATPSAQSQDRSVASRKRKHADSISAEQLSPAESRKINQLKEYMTQRSEIKMQMKIKREMLAKLSTEIHSSVSVMKKTEIKEEIEKLTVQILNLKEQYSQISKKYADTIAQMDRESSSSSPFTEENVNSSNARNTASPQVQEEAEESKKKPADAISAMDLFTFREMPMC